MYLGLALSAPAVAAAPSAPTAAAVVADAAALIDAVADGSAMSRDWFCIRLLATSKGQLKQVANTAPQKPDAKVWALSAMPDCAAVRWWGRCGGVIGGGDGDGDGGDGDGDGGDGDGDGGGCGDDVIGGVGKGS